MRRMAGLTAEWVVLNFFCKGWLCASLRGAGAVTTAVTGDGAAAGASDADE
jgi:hypothetical protein